MAPPFFRGPEASLWLEMSLCQTRMQKHMWPTQPDGQALQPIWQPTARRPNNQIRPVDQDPYVFYPVAIETAGTWHHQAIELVEEIGKRTINITGDQTETAYLLQQLTVRFKGETRFLFRVPSLPANPLQSVIFFYLMSVCLLGCLPGRPSKIIIIIIIIIIIVHGKVRCLSGR